MNLAGLEMLRRKVGAATAFIDVLALQLGYETINNAALVTGLDRPRLEVWLALDQIPGEARDRVVAAVAEAAGHLAMGKPFKTVDLWASDRLVAHVIDAWPKEM